MPSEITPADLVVLLTRSGYIALGSDHKLPPAQEAELFSDSGRYPPVRLSDLTRQTLDIIKAAPDTSDTADLAALAETLKASLTMVKDAIADLTEG